MIHLAPYQTNQKKELIAFLEKHKDEAFTIDEIVQAMEKDPQFSTAPGKSTVYRLMSSFVEKNMVKRFSKGTGLTASYQIVGGKSCLSHMHLKCTGCGRLLHMSDTDSQLFIAQIEQKIDFTVDPAQTLIYGRCADCLAAELKKGPVNDDYETDH